MSYDGTLTPSIHAYIVYDIVYDIVRPTYDIVCQNTVLASHTCDIVYDVVYDIIRFLPVLASRTVSHVLHRIRHRMFFDDVAYDVQGNIDIIRYRT